MGTMSHGTFCTSSSPSSPQSFSSFKHKHGQGFWNALRHLKKKLLEKWGSIRDDDACAHQLRSSREKKEPPGPNRLPKIRPEVLIRLDKGCIQCLRSSPLRTYLAVPSKPMSFCPLCPPLNSALNLAIRSIYRWRADENSSVRPDCNRVSPNKVSAVQSRHLVTVHLDEVCPHRILGRDPVNGHIRGGTRTSRSTAAKSHFSHVLFFSPCIQMLPTCQLAAYLRSPSFVHCKKFPCLASLIAKSCLRLCRMQKRKLLLQ